MRSTKLVLPCGIKISVIIPAHNEEKFLPLGLNAVERAKEQVTCDVEVIVVLNRCTDKTEEIARNFGAKLVYEEAKNLARIRNAGLEAASGDIVMTVDADSRLHPMTFVDVIEKLKSGKYIGGGAAVQLERWSIGIFFSALVVIPHLLKYRVSFGVFWTTREACEAIGGFDESFVTIEDLDFATRLKKLGKERGLKFGTLYRSYLTTSCRKFDQYGDWHLFRDQKFLRQAMEGTNREAGDKYWYNPDR